MPLFDGVEHLGEHVGDRDVDVSTTCRVQVKFDFDEAVVAREDEVVKVSDVGAYAVQPEVDSGEVFTLSEVV